MKEYKTWEMLKMLEENPKLKFKKTSWGEGSYITPLETGKVINEYKLFHKIIYAIDDRWILIQEPISWQEAVEAIIDGKNIRALCRDCSVSNCYFKACDSNSICIDGIKNGVWFIED